MKEKIILDKQLKLDYFTLQPFGDTYTTWMLGLGGGGLVILDLIFGEVLVWCGGEVITRLLLHETKNIIYKPPTSTAQLARQPKP